MAVVVFLLGTALGSFLNVAADRLPRGKSLLWPRSACDACQRPLSRWDLAPVLSYLVLRGRCRYCGVRIPLRVPLMEVAMGALLLGVYLQQGLSVELVVFGGAAAFFLTIAAIDFDHQLILNKTLLPAAAVALVVSSFWPELGFPRSFFGSSGYVAALLNSVVTGAAAFGAFAAIAVISRGGMGWGDVKLALVLGLLFGYPAVLFALWLAIVTGGLVALGLLITRRKGRKEALPFGVFLAGGAIATLFLLGWITSRYLEMGLRGFTV